ncbi:MAG: hypothetical protein C0448_06910 [Sphingobacteriaceae bacterium]|nr:hypothetical protein [Sphingobacteriaceae bacterium]
MRPTKVNKRTLPKRKPAKANDSVSAANKTKKATLRQAQGTKKVKPKFSLKGIPVKYKHICNLAIEHAHTQTQCDELLLAGVNAYETLLENETPENAEKLKLDVVAKAILIKKQSFPPIID